MTSNEQKMSRERLRILEEKLDQINECDAAINYRKHQIKANKFLEIFQKKRDPLLISIYREKDYLMYLQKKGTIIESVRNFQKNMYAFPANIHLNFNQLSLIIVYYDDLQRLCGFYCKGTRGPSFSIKGKELDFSQVYEISINQTIKVEDRIRKIDEILNFFITN